jgi:DNA-binding transcriptional MerR regulator
VAKGPDAFRTISEAADELHVPQHVLRFWETKFTFIKPMKRAGGRRFYRPSDIAILAGVRRLLHDEGYTIKGVQKLHREQGVRRLVLAGDGAAAPSTVAAPPAAIPSAAAKAKAKAKGDKTALLDALHDLETAKARLDGLLRD